MTWLAIDTSTELASVAILHEDKLFTLEKEGRSHHAQCLLPMIEQLLKEAKLSISDLDAIIFGRGPGSFTGLRIACSVAKGLAYAHDLPLYPVSSLEAIANEVYAQEGISFADTPVLSVIDARMQEVYWTYFTKDSLYTEEKVTPASDVQVNGQSSILLAGVGFEAYEHLFSDVIQSRIVKQCRVFPTARAMIRIVQNGQINSITAEEALPVYVRNQVTQGGASSG